MYFAERDRERETIEGKPIQCSIEYYFEILQWQQASDKHPHNLDTAEYEQKSSVPQKWKQTVQITNPHDMAWVSTRTWFFVFFFIPLHRWNACTQTHMHRQKSTWYTLNKIRRYNRLAVSLLCNCSSNLAKLNSVVTLDQGSSTTWPPFSSCWNKCISLFWRIDALASTGE